MSSSLEPMWELFVTSSLLRDALGSAVVLADSAGTVQTEYTYEPFGKTSSTGASNTSSYQYTGRENDGTALYYYRARYYHPILQIFISEDPFINGGSMTLPFLKPLLLGNPLMLHSYAYTANNPVNLRDPEGLYPAGPGRHRPWNLRCFLESMYEFIKCMGELGYGPGPMTPGTAITACGYCLRSLFYDPASCSVCVLGIMNYGVGSFECLRKADRVDLECNKCPPK